MTMPEITELDEGLEFIEKGIQNLKLKLEGCPDTNFTAVDRMSLYNKIYSMCCQKPPHDYSKELYDKYKECIEDYVTSKVLPSLREKHDELLLIQLLENWGIYKDMLKSLSSCFEYLDRYYVPRNTLQTLNEAGRTCFRNLVFEEFKDKLMDTMISLIAQEDEQKPIDGDVLKRVVDVFQEIGARKDFEEAFLKETAAYYSYYSEAVIFKSTCTSFKS